MTPFLVIDIGIDPVLIKLGPLAVHWYGLMYVVGILVGLRAALPYAERAGVSQDAVYQLFWPVLVAALIGGRLYYVAQSNLGWYLHHPSKILATWEGGMAFYGAVFLGVPAAYLACRRLGVPFPHVLDAAALFIPAAQSLGRVGNIINGDIVGYPSSLPWAVRYTNPHNSFVVSHATAYQPAAAYEMLFSAALFGVIWALRDRLSVPGELFAVWLFLYSAGQFVLFFTRSNPVLWLGLRQAQWTAVLVCVCVVPAAWTWQRRYLPHRPDEGPVPDRWQSGAHPRSARMVTDARDTPSRDP